MKAFQMAAKHQVEREGSDQQAPPEEYPIKFTIGPHELRAKAPTPAQTTLLIGTSQLGGNASLGAMYRFLRGTLDANSYNILLTLIEAGDIDDDFFLGASEGNEEGLVDWLITQEADRPTQPPVDSSSSSSTGGKKSTGRSPGKGSTLSE